MRDPHPRSVEDSGFAGRFTLGVATRPRPLRKHNLIGCTRSPQRYGHFERSNSPLQAAHVPILNHPRHETCRRRGVGPWLGHRQGKTRPDVEHHLFTQHVQQFMRYQAHHPPLVTSNPCPPFPARRPTSPPALYPPPPPWDA